MSIDGQLQHAVLEELGWEPSVTAAHIGVMADDGVVTLTGHVESFGEKHAAAAAAWRVKGVKAVAEEIEVKLPLERIRTDDDIAAAVLERLAWDPWVPPDAVGVTVDNGWITLTGTVNWRYQLDAAEQDVRRLHGVVGLSNQLVVTPMVIGTNTAEAIRQALHRALLSPGHAIQVTALGGRVHLTGAVHTRNDLLLAERTAWAAPGTMFVDNDVEVL